MQTLFTFLLLLYSPVLCAQEKKKDVAYSVVFASCFSNDTVSLKVNGTTIIPDTRITTDFSSGTTYLSVYQDKEGIWVINKTDKEKQPLISIQGNLKLEVVLNGQWTAFNIKLKKGKTIFIDHCYVKEGEERKQKLTFTQNKKTVQLY